MKELPRKIKPLMPDEALAILKSVIKNKDRDGLHEWVELFIGINIPKNKVCPIHDPPFDFVADYFFDNFKTAIVLANRTGGKTLSFAVLDTITPFLYEDVEVATLGAILPQAKKCYSYFEKFSSKKIFPSGIVSRTQEKTTYKNESLVQILTGTISGVNSPHPQVVFLDEIDLMLWTILQQALSMAISKPHFKAKTIYTSTRKFPVGSMQRMLDNAPATGTKVYTWCIWDVVEKLPDKKDPMYNQIIKTFGKSLPPEIVNADGFYTWSDVIDKRRLADDETWETEWLCLKPAKDAVVYGHSFDEDRNIVDKDPEFVDIGSWYLFEDFGGSKTHPDRLLLTYIPPEFDRLYIVNEKYLEDCGTDEIWSEAEDLLKTQGLEISDLAGWIPDPHGLTEIKDREARGAPIMPKNEESQLYLILNGVSLVKKLLESGRLLIHARCKWLIEEMKSYKYKKNLDGTYSKDPEKKNDHGPDALRYGVVVLFPFFSDADYANIDEDRRSEKVEKTLGSELKREFSTKKGQKTGIFGNLKHEVF